MNRLLNFLHQWRLRSEIAATEGWEFIKLRYARAANSLYLGAIALLVLVVSGVIFGFAGYSLDAKWLIGLGQFAIALGGAIATGVMVLFYLRMVVATHALQVADGLLEFLSKKKISNFFSKDTGLHVRGEFLNVFAWVAAFCLLCNIVPVWKYPVALPIFATFGFFFAFASAKSWTFVEKPIGKAIVFGGLAIMFLANVMNVFTVGAMSEWVGERGELTAAVIRDDTVVSRGQRAILEEKASFAQEAAKVRLWEYQRLAKRQIRIMGDCQRDTPALKAEFAKNAARMAVLEGQNRPAKRARREQTAPVPAPPVVSEAETRIAVPAGNTLAQTGSRFSSNWGWLLIAVLVVGLCVLACVGFATKQTWLSAPATLLLVALAIIGSCIWIANRPGASWFSGSRIPPAQLRLQVPLKMPQSTFVVRSISGGSSVFNRAPSEGRPTHAFSAPIYEPARPPARGLRDALDEIVPEQPGDWR